MARVLFTCRKRFKKCQLFLFYSLVAGCGLLGMLQGQVWQVAGGRQTTAVSRPPGEGGRPQVAGGRPVAKMFFEAGRPANYSLPSQITHLSKENVDRPLWGDAQVVVGEMARRFAPNAGRGQLQTVPSGFYEPESRQRQRAIDEREKFRLVERQEVRSCVDVG